MSKVTRVLLVLGLTAGLFATNASAALIVELRITGVQGAGLLQTGDHSVQVVGPTDAASRITMDIIAHVTGANGTFTDEGLQYVQGGFVSNLVSGGAVVGELTALRWDGLGSAPNANVAFNTGTGLVEPDGLKIPAAHGLGGMDISAGTSASQANSFQDRAGAITNFPAQVVDAAGQWFKIGTLTYTNIAPIGTGLTNLTFVRRDANAAGLWREDGATKTFGSVGMVFSTIPVEVSAVPEPAMVALLITGLGALGLTFFRRKRG